MSNGPDRSSRLHDLRTFAAGAGCGFLAGAFAVALIVWQYGNFVGSRAASLARPADPPAATARWGDGLDPVDGAVIEEAPPHAMGTTGSVPATVDGGPEVPAGAGPLRSTELSDRDFHMPVDGVTPDDLTRQFSDPRGEVRRHEAIDILAPRNTPVRAVEDGRIARLFNSKAGGITIYQFDPSERFCYYYAHLERYALGLREGDRVRKGQIIGYVGTSGNAPANTPHLHFAIFRLTAEKRWWEGTPIDPYDVLR